LQQCFKPNGHGCLSSAGAGSGGGQRASRARVRAHLTAAVMAKGCSEARAAPEGRGFRAIPRGRRNIRGPDHRLCYGLKGNFMLSAGQACARRPKESLDLSRGRCPPASGPAGPRHGAGARVQTPGAQACDAAQPAAPSRCGGAARCGRGAALRRVDGDFRRCGRCNLRRHPLFGEEVCCEISICDRRRPKRAERLWNETSSIAAGARRCPRKCGSAAPRRRSKSGAGAHAPTPARCPRAAGVRAAAVCWLRGTFRCGWRVSPPRDSLSPVATAAEAAAGPNTSRGS
jgi:hypothetical protein